MDDPEQTLRQRLDRFLERAAPGGESLERHDELLAMAEAEGVPRPLGEAVWEIAEEEGLHPPLAFALVVCGIAVRDFDDPEPDAEAVEPVEPEWVEEEPRVPAETAEEERRLRRTFRRLRSLIDEYEDRDEALAVFVAAPDLEAYDY